MYNLNIFFGSPILGKEIQYLIQRHFKVQIVKFKEFSRSFQTSKTEIGYIAEVNFKIQLPIIFYLFKFLPILKFHFAFTNNQG